MGDLLNNQVYMFMIFLTFVFLVRLVINVYDIIGFEDKKIEIPIEKAEYILI